MALNEPLRADGAAVIPFPSKAAYYTQMAEEAARQVTGSRVSTKSTTQLVVLVLCF